MSINRRVPALFAIAVLACAAPRALRGHIDITAAHPEALFEKQHTDVRVEDRRIVASAPFAGTPAESWLTDDGCVHTISEARSVAFCPLPGDPNSFSGALGLGFSVKLRQMGNILRVTQDGEYADIALGHDAVGDEFRDHPALLGVIVRLGALPRSTDGVYVTHSTPEPQADAGAR